MAEVQRCYQFSLMAIISEPVETACEMWYESRAQSYLHMVHCTYPLLAVTDMAIVRTVCVISDMPSLHRTRA